MFYPALSWKMSAFSPSKTSRAHPNIFCSLRASTKSLVLTISPLEVLIRIMYFFILAIVSWRNIDFTFFVIYLHVTDLVDEMIGVLEHGEDVGVLQQVIQIHILSIGNLLDPFWSWKGIKTRNFSNKSGHFLNKFLANETSAYDSDLSHIK